MISSTDILHASILIVDDREANVLLLDQMLRSAGYDAVSSTMDPEKVCELHLRNHYDLILLDLQMPRMDGFQVMENLKEIEKDSYLPVLVITAQPDHKLRALRAGARDFVSKPLDVAEVLARVHNLLEVRLLHQESRRLYERVLAEQQAAEALLRRALPGSLAELLRGRTPAADGAGAGLITESYAEVTVLFGDIVAFTTFAEGASASVLRAVLDDIAARFDGPTGAHRLERSQTIGEAYLAAMLLPDAVTEHTIRASHQALDLIEAVDRFNAHSRYQLRLSIGIEPGDAEVGQGGSRRRLHNL
jgi:adenylate cyclase